MTNDELNRWCAEKEGWVCHVCGKAPRQPHRADCIIGWVVQPPEYHNNVEAMLRVCDIVAERYCLENRIEYMDFGKPSKKRFHLYGWLKSERWFIGRGETRLTALRAALEAVAEEE